MMIYQIANTQMEMVKICVEAIKTKKINE